MRSGSRTRAGAWLLLLAAAWVATVAAGPCRADADRSVLESSRRATGFVFAEFKDVLSMGTGFCIDASAGLFITNNHVIANKGELGRVSIVLSPGTPKARTLGATIVKADANLDLALLRTDRPTNLHAVDLAGAGRLGRLRETQEVLALGYPFGLELAAPGAAPEVSVSTGRITALRHDGGRLALIQFDGSINHGNSGGPLLDKYGDVIGVVTAIVPDKQINLAIPASFVRVLLAEANLVIAPPALSDPQMRAQLVEALDAPPKGRRPAPSEAAQKAALKLVRDVFAAEYADKSKAGQAALVYRLLDESQADKDDPAGRYALLNEARDAAIRAGDFTAAVYATDALVNAFDVSPLDWVADLMRRMGPRLSGQDAADGATVSLMLVEALAGQNLFADARKWLPSTRAIAYASHNSKVVSAVGEAVARVEFAAEATDRGRAALAKLKADPADPEENLAAGEYECFVRGDFATGSTHLAKGSNAALKQAAAAELARPATPDAERACGDLWWDNATAAGAKTPSIGDACRKRAVYWYRRAAPKLTGLAKLAIDRRLGEDGMTPPAASAKSPEASRATATQPQTTRVAATAGWVHTDFSVQKGQCYRITATGTWKDSDGVECGPVGACPQPCLALLGPQTELTDAQRKQFYCGQHPRGALICRIGDEQWDFYVTTECRFLAPESGRLSFRMNDDDRGNTSSKAGACSVSVSRIEPKWVRSDGRVEIIARIDTTDWLHLTPKGPYWEWDGNWGKVGLHDGYYPTVINGIYCWPHWNGPKTTDPLPIPELWPANPGHVRVVGVEAKRGDVDIIHADEHEVVVQFHKHRGNGSTQIAGILATR